MANLQFTFFLHLMQDFFENQAEILQAHTKALMAGWLQLIPETDAFIYFAEKTAEEPFSTKKILQAYHSL